MMGKFAAWFRGLSTLRRAGVVVAVALIVASLVRATLYAEWVWLLLAAAGPGYSLWLIRKFQRQEAREQELLARAEAAGVAVPVRKADR